MTLGFILLYPSALMEWYSPTTGMPLVWEASTFPQHLKDVLGSEGGRPGKVSDSEMLLWLDLGIFPSLHPFLLKMHQTMLPKGQKGPVLYIFISQYLVKNPTIS